MPYTLTGIQKQQVTIEVSENDITRLILSGDINPKVLIAGLTECLKKSAGFSTEFYIDNNTKHWSLEVENHGSHKWFSTETFRLATIQEQNFMEILNQLSEALTLVELSK